MTALLAGLAACVVLGVAVVGLIDEARRPPERRRRVGAAVATTLAAAGLALLALGVHVDGAYCGTGLGVLTGLSDPAAVDASAQALTSSCNTARTHRLLLGLAIMVLAVAGLLWTRRAGGVSGRPGRQARPALR